MGTQCSYCAVICTCLKLARLKVNRMITFIPIDGSLLTWAQGLDGKGGYNSHSSGGKHLNL